MTINIFSLTSRSILPTSFWTPTVCQTWIREVLYHLLTPASWILWPFIILEKQLTSLKQNYILTRQSETYIVTKAVAICLKKLSSEQLSFQVQTADLTNWWVSLKSNVERTLSKVIKEQTNTIKETSLPGNQHQLVRWQQTPISGAPLLLQFMTHSKTRLFENFQILASAEVSVRHFSISKIDPYYQNYGNFPYMQTFAQCNLRDFTYRTFLLRNIRFFRFFLQKHQKCKVRVSTGKIGSNRDHWMLRFIQTVVCDEVIQILTLRNCNFLFRFLTFSFFRFLLLFSVCNVENNLLHGREARSRFVRFLQNKYELLLSLQLPSVCWRSFRTGIALPIKS